MALRDTMVEKARPHLQPGEQVQAVFGGQKISQWWLLLSVLVLLFANKYRVVVVTDRRILVLAGTTWSQSKVTGVLAEVPRAVQIGPPSGLWWKCTSLGEPLYVHKRFHKDVVAADTRRPVHPGHPGHPSVPPPSSPPPGY
ncbi:hypothetical protein [Nocardioides sp. 1609]|uniref:hypothetical protein n=1 Tax=Nocardioides sp. 1609 TaxID=2508327 RepID=UPI00106FC71C|nr:hypothetical protein [Nocardioides sp. 1609]